MKFGVTCPVARRTLAGITMGGAILITGAGGFVGSAVTRRIVRWAEGGGIFWDGEPASDVCALLRPDSSEERLEIVRHSPVLRLERADITNTGRLQEILCRHRPKAILHLAFDRSGFAAQSEAEWRACHLSPIETMFDALSRSDGTRFVHTGTAWVLAPGERLDENARVAPTLEYARVKAKLDDALAPLTRKYGVPFINLRLFNIFGRYERKYRLLPHLVDQWRCGRPARLSHGNQLRDFNDVDDIAESYRLALICPPSACGALYHIGSGRGVSVRQFASMVSAAMDMSCEIELDAVWRRDQHLCSLICDPGLAMRVLGWRPADDLESRIRASVDWWIARSVLSDELVS